MGLKLRVPLAPLVPGRGTQKPSLGQHQPDRDTARRPVFGRAGGAPATLAAATPGMAGSMGRGSSATDSDSERKLALREGQQCDDYQGPLVGPPLTAAAFAKKWMTAQSNPGALK